MAGNEQDLIYFSDTISFFSKHLSHEEAVRCIRSIHNPVLASKKLVDMAQSYGAKENLAVLIVRFNFQKKIHYISNTSSQQQRLSRQQTYSANTNSGRSNIFHENSSSYSR
jgi:serine/threonine protein phosphatase PrpC